MKLSLILLVASASGTIRSAWSLVSPLEGSSSSARREFLQSAATIPVAAASATCVTGQAFTAAPAIAANKDLQGQITLPPIGLGAWSWGDSLFWGYDAKNDETLRQVFDYAIENSKTSTSLFDTAEIYGFGRSEKLLGEFSKKYAPEKVQIATKFAAVPFRSKANDVVNACEASLKRLGRPIDLYQIHFPGGWSNEAFWDGLAMAYEKGLVKSVGVSNYGVVATRACHDALAKRGIQLATNQIQLSLLYRWPVENGLLQCCNDLGIQVLSYSPLALGMLTGKYSPENLPSGPRQAVYKALIVAPDYDNLLGTMRDIAAGHKDSTLSQIAINWTRAKTTIPIPGARTLSQIQQNYGALDWKLSNEEEQALDLAAAKVTTFITPDKSPFPRVDINTKMKMFDS